MARTRTESTTIRNQDINACYKKRVQGLIKKINELTILCDLTACLIFFSREENKVKAWPSPVVAKSLIERFYSMSDMKRAMKSDDQESFIKTNTAKIEKKLADSRRVIDEIEMDLLLAELHNGRKLLGDLTQSQIEKLKVFSEKKVKGFKREMSSKGHPYAKPDLVDERKMGSVFASGWGMMNSSRPMESRGKTVDFNNFKWFGLDEPKVEKPCDDEDMESSHDSEDTESSDDDNDGHMKSSDDDNDGHIKSSDDDNDGHMESSDDESDDVNAIWSSTSSSSSDGEDDE